MMMRFFFFRGLFFYTHSARRDGVTNKIVFNNIKSELFICSLNRAVMCLDMN